MKLTKMTPREVDVWEALAVGMSSAEIAEHLGMKPKTVENITSTLYRKLELRNQGGAKRVKAARLWWIADAMTRSLVDQELPCDGDSPSENSGDGGPDTACP